jgi:2-C-methyl-D-erythritol 2,4-cyclodiphosphate synthase
MTLHRLRIGEGWDTHQLVAGRPLVLGGVTIPHSHGLLGHSDADALLHAITDALLGAAALGDIGRHFPDTDPAFRGADSLALLAERPARARRRLANRSTSTPPSSPRRRGWRRTSRRCAERIAGAGSGADAVNVKAKTAEKMGPVGEGQAIEARAVCLLLIAGSADGSAIRPRA